MFDLKFPHMLVFASIAQMSHKISNIYLYCEKALPLFLSLAPTWKQGLTISGWWDLLVLFLLSSKGLVLT